MKVQRTFTSHKIALKVATERGEVVSHVRYRGALHLTEGINIQEGDYPKALRQIIAQLTHA